jgi:hemerythrin
MTMIALWNDDYCTGNEQIDQEHQELFELVNTLHAAMLQWADRSSLKGILDHLASHTIDHFKTEELFMVIEAYPGYERHKLAHDKLTSKVVTLIHQFQQGQTELDVELTQFLAEWLGHHIKGEDQKMIQFFQSRLGGQVAGAAARRGDCCRSTAVCLRVDAVLTSSLKLGCSRQAIEGDAYSWLKV